MRGQLRVVVEAKKKRPRISRAVQNRAPRDNPLDITLAHLFANETLFMPVSHVLEQLVRREKRLVAKLEEGLARQSAREFQRRPWRRLATHLAHRMRRSPTVDHLLLLFTPDLWFSMAPWHSTRIVQR